MGPRVVLKVSGCTSTPIVAAQAEVNEKQNPRAAQRGLRTNPLSRKLACTVSFHLEYLREINTLTHIETAARRKWRERKKDSRQLMVSFQRTKVDLPVPPSPTRIILKTGIGFAWEREVRHAWTPACCIPFRHGLFFLASRTMARLLKAAKAKNACAAPRLGRGDHLI